MSFLKPVDAPQTILLDTCPEDRKEALYGTALRMTRARMTEIVKMYVPLAATGSLSFGPKHFNLTRTLQEWITDRYRGYLDPQRELVPHLLCMANLKRAVDAWPANYRAVATYALNNVFVGLEKVRSIISENPVKITLSSGRQTYVTPEMVLSIMNTEQSGVINLYSFTPAVAPIVGKALGLKSFSGTSATTDILPEDHIETFSGEGDMIGKFAVLKTVVDSNEIYLSGTGFGVRVGDVNAIAAAVNLANPFDVSKLKYFAKFRAKAVALLYLTGRAALAVKKDKKPYGIPDLLQASVENVDYTFLVNCALPFFDKLGKSNFCEINGRLVINTILSALSKYAIKNLPEDKNDVWIDCESLVDEILLKLPAKEKFGMDLSVIRGYTDVYDNITLSKVQVQNVIGSFTKPLIRGIIAVLVAGGIVEMAYNPALLDSQRPYDALKYVRLSGIGRFVLGCDPKYRPRMAVEKVTASIELDPDNLILKIQKSSATQFIKNQVGKKISSSRYLVDATTLSRKIQTRADLDNRITILKEMAAINELPPIWEALVNTVARRITAIKAEHAEDWSMYVLNGKISELVELLRSEPEIRKLILMVEGGRFLVKQDNIATLRLRLAERGFILPPPADQRSSYWYDRY